jgi:hypothetical protein
MAQLSGFDNTFILPKIIGFPGKHLRQKESGKAIGSLAAFFSHI